MAEAAAARPSGTTSDRIYFTILTVAVEVSCF
jgi:hypothetical protein